MKVDFPPRPDCSSHWLTLSTFNSLQELDRLFWWPFLLRKASGSDQIHCERKGEQCEHGTKATRRLAKGMSSNVLCRASDNKAFRGRSLSFSIRATWAVTVSTAFLTSQCLLLAKQSTCGLLWAKSGLMFAVVGSKGLVYICGSRNMYIFTCSWTNKFHVGFYFF